MEIKIKLSGHQSFTFRNTWLTKGIQNIKKQPTLFKNPDALVTLGVGKNMVSSIKYWCTALQLMGTERIDGKYQDIVTDIGEKLFLGNEINSWDCYLEDIGTLWLIHYLYTTNSNFATTAFYVFNFLVSVEFSRNSLVHEVELWANRLGVNTSINTIRRDVNTFFHTYIGTLYQESDSKGIEESLACPLTELGLLTHLRDEDVFLLARGPRPSLPDEIFLFALARFIEENQQQTVSFSELSYGEKGPGRIFRLDESSLTERLEKLEILTSGNWVLTETAGIRQILIRKKLSTMDILQQYYL